MRLPLWGVQKVDLQLIEWRWSDLHPIVFTSTLSCPSIPQNRPSLLSTPPQTVDISWLLPPMGDTALTIPLPSDHYCSIVAVAIALSSSHCCRCHCRRHSWRRRSRHAAAITVYVTFIIAAIVTTILVVGVVAVDVAIATVIVDIVALLLLRLVFSLVGPKQAKAVSPMACWWSNWSWVVFRVADGVARTTSCPWCRPVGNIMVLSNGVEGKVP